MSSLHGPLPPPVPEIATPPISNTAECASKIYTQLNKILEKAPSSAPETKTSWVTILPRPPQDANIESPTPAMVSPTACLNADSRADASASAPTSAPALQALADTAAAAAASSTAGWPNSDDRAGQPKGGMPADVSAPTHVENQLVPFGAPASAASAPRPDLSAPNPVKALSFPAKLHAILSRNDIADIISWMPHGRAWRVHKPKAFESKVIPEFFVQCKYSSFIRQANGWGFRRMTRGVDRNAYYNEYFLRGRLHLCQQMRRPATSNKLPADPENEPNFYAMSEIDPLPEMGTPTEDSEANNLVVAPRKAGPGIRLAPGPGPVFGRLCAPGVGEPNRTQPAKNALPPENIQAEVLLSSATLPVHAGGQPPPVHIHAPVLGQHGPPFPTRRELGTMPQAQPIYPRVQAQPFYPRARAQARPIPLPGMLQKVPIHPGTMVPGHITNSKVGVNPRASKASLMATSQAAEEEAALHLQRYEESLRSAFAKKQEFMRAIREEEHARAMLEAEEKRARIAFLEAEKDLMWHQQQEWLRRGIGPEECVGPLSPVPTAGPHQIGPPGNEKLEPTHEQHCAALHCRTDAPLPRHKAAMPDRAMRPCPPTLGDDLGGLCSGELLELSEYCRARRAGMNAAAAGAVAAASVDQFSVKKHGIGRHSGTMPPSAQWPLPEGQMRRKLPFR